MNATPLKQVGTIAHPEIGDVAIMDGITEKQIEQLITYANTDQALQFTSDPRRFKDRTTFNTWQEKGRTIYTLTDVSGDLLGIVWLGMKEIPDRVSQEYKSGYGITFAIRMYGKARGKHLARNFLEITFNLFRLSEQYKTAQKKGIWLETVAANTPAVTTYSRFGFKKIVEPDEKGNILMVLPLTFM